MVKIKITEINVAERMRKRLDNERFDALISSMSRIGQIQPIVIDQNNFLIAGGRRLAAAKELQWDEIEAIRREDVDPALSKEIELEENLRREDLHWTEEVCGIEKLFTIKQERYGKGQTGGKGQKGTAALVDRVDGKVGYNLSDMETELDRTSTSLSMDLTLARALREYPEIGDEPTKSSAFKRYRLKKETALREEQARRTRPSVTKTFDEFQEEKNPDAPAVTRQPVKRTIFKERESVLFHGDSRDICKYLAERHIKVDCIVTDPPFGLGMHKEGQTIAGSRLADNVGAMYDDDPHAIMDMLDQVFMWCGKILKPDGHAYVFFHMTRYEETFKMLRNQFGVCDETPITWIKNTPGIGDPNRTWVYAYEPCFFINRGRMLVNAQAFNYLKFDTIPPGQKIHPTEKPATLLRHLINASCVSGELVLDPFSGSGSTLVAADQVGCKFIGIERKESFYRASIDRLAERIHSHQTKEKEGLLETPEPRQVAENE
jgi:site-specific DNA-methyltransferase (adenine-specific)